MHLLFDNYENKNSVIIKVLDKKLIIQQKELKDLKESNSKISRCSTMTEKIQIKIQQTKK